MKFCSHTFVLTTIACIVSCAYLITYRKAMDIYIKDYVSLSTSPSVTIVDSEEASATLRDAWEAVPFKNSSKLPRLLDLEKTRASIEFAKNVSSFLSFHGVEHLMMMGNLLGSYFSHSLLPWDDDLDMFVHNKDFQTLSALARSGVSQKNSITILTQCPKKKRTDNGTTICLVSKFKVFWSESPWPARGNYNWKMPFVDIQMYDSNTTHVWFIDNPPWVFPKTTFYPLKMRPLNGVLFPSPREPYDIFVSKYGRIKQLNSIRQMQCTWPYWDHWQQRGRSIHKSAPCKDLINDYPFVRRTLLGDGRVQEDVVVGDHVYYSYITREKFDPAWQPLPYLLKWIAKEIPRVHQPLYKELATKG